MTIPAEALAERLSTIREETCAALLRALATSLNDGAEVEAEPIHRAPDGAVLREGRLDLPRRGDLAVTRDGRTLVRQIESPPAQDFKPFVAFSDTDFSAEIQPFSWDHAVLDMRTAQAQPSWTAFRHWYLEWFQSRPTDLSPELAGAIHRLQGPWRAPGRWRAILDLGSAPTASIAVLIAAISQSGCARLRIGGE